MMMMTVSVLMVATSGTLDGEPTHISQMRLNYGVVFRQINFFDLVTDTWRQSFVIEIPKVNRSLLRQDLIQCEDVLQENRQHCRQLTKYVHYLQNVTRRAVLEIDRIVGAIRANVAEVRLRPRDNPLIRGQGRRGLFNFVGDLSHALFGTARDIDVTHFKQTVQHIAGRQHLLSTSIQQVQNRMSSYSKAINSRVDGIVSMLDIQRSSISDLTAALQTQVEDELAIDTWIAHTIDRLKQFTVLLSNLNAFKQGVDSLISGLLHPELLPPRDLFYALNTIKLRVQNMQQQDDYTMRVLRSRVRCYFRIHDFLAGMYDHHIFIQLSIPLGIFPTFLNLYEVIKIPMVTLGTDHATILGDYPHYIAYHPESEYFMEFDIKPDITHSKLLFSGRCWKHSQICCTSIVSFGFVAQ